MKCQILGAISYSDNSDRFPPLFFSMEGKLERGMIMKKKNILILIIGSVFLV